MKENEIPELDLTFKRIPVKAKMYKLKYKFSIEDALEQAKRLNPRYPKRSAFEIQVDWDRRKMQRNLDFIGTLC